LLTCADEDTRARDGRVTRAARSTATSQERSRLRAAGPRVARKTTARDMTARDMTRAKPGRSQRPYRRSMGCTDDGWSWVLLRSNEAAWRRREQHPGPPHSISPRRGNASMETTPQRKRQARRVPSDLQCAARRSDGRKPFEVQTSNAPGTYRVQSLRSVGCSFCAVSAYRYAREQGHARHGSCAGNADARTRGAFMVPEGPDVASAKASRAATSFRIAPTSRWRLPRGSLPRSEAVARELRWSGRAATTRRPLPSSRRPPRWSWRRSASWCLPS
jgi:hypothetical protein